MQFFIVQTALCIVGHLAPLAPAPSAKAPLIIVAMKETVTRFQTL